MNHDAEHLDDGDEPDAGQLMPVELLQIRTVSQCCLNKGDLEMANVIEVDEDDAPSIHDIAKDLAGELQLQTRLDTDENGNSNLVDESGICKLAQSTVAQRSQPTSKSSSTSTINRLKLVKLPSIKFSRPTVVNKKSKKS